MRLPPTSCPGCNAKLDAATHGRQATPKEGDITVCLYCASVLTFVLQDEHLRVKVASADYLSGLPPGVRRELVRLVGAVRQRKRDDG